MTSLRGHERQEFPQSVRKAAFRRCCAPDGIPKCETCGKPLRSGHIVYEHMQPDGLSGEPTLENCRVNCDGCAARKTHEEDNPRMAKADRVLKKNYGLKSQGPPMPGSRRSQWKRRMNGTVERR